MLNLTFKLLLIVLVVIIQSCLPSLPQPLFVQQTNTFTLPGDGWERSFYNEGYDKGWCHGFDTGYTNGYAAGDNAGYRRGVMEGKRLAEYELLDSLKTVQAADDLRLLLIERMFSNKDSLDKLEGMREAGYTAGLHDGKKLAYVEAYQRGFNDAFDSLYPINLLRGQAIKYQVYDPQKMNLTIPYERIARFIARELQQESYLNRVAFAQLLKEVHTRFISMVSQLVELDGQEGADMFLRYEEMHEALSDLYYRNYLQKIRLKHRDLDKNFYDYRYHLSSSEFVHVVKTGICSLMDVLITYAKNNSQSATIYGFEVMGHICEILHREPLQEFEDGLLKSALVFDYDINVKKLTQTLRNILSNQTVEILSRIVNNSSVYLDIPDFGVDIERELVQVFAVGFDTSEVSVAVDHNEQKFLIQLSERPVILKELFEYGIPTYIRAETLCYASPVSTTKTLKVDKHQWETLANGTLAGPPETIPSITVEAVEELVPFFRKFMEPAVTLPTSCYNVYLEFEGREISLLETDCSHG